MTEKTIIDEDLCATCRHCSLLKPPPARRTWDLPAICAAGFPFNEVFHNVISGCDRYIKKEVAK